MDGGTHNEVLLLKPLKNIANVKDHRQAQTYKSQRGARTSVKESGVVFTHLNQVRSNVRGERSVSSIDLDTTGSIGLGVFSALPKQKVPQHDDAGPKTGPSHPRTKRIFWYTAAAGCSGVGELQRPRGSHDLHGTNKFSHNCQK